MASGEDAGPVPADEGGTRDLSFDRQRNATGFRGPLRAAARRRGQSHGRARRLPHRRGVGASLCERRRGLLAAGAGDMRLIVLAAFLCAVAQAQWLNYPTPGTPRTPDGKPDLTAPAPHTADGKPDLSGVWMHEKTTIAEVRRLFGTRFDSEITLAPPGILAKIIGAPKTKVFISSVLDLIAASPNFWLVVAATKLS